MKASREGTQARDQALFRRQLASLPAFRALLRTVEARFYADLPMPRPILDLGCGDGHFAAMAFDAAPPDVGLDPDMASLREAQGRRLYRLLTLASGASLPFADASFATVVSNSVLEHIPHLAPVLPEVARVLRSGGWFHFCVPGPNFRRYLSVARVLDALHLPALAEQYRRLFDRISRHYTYDPPEAWEARLSRAGLRLERWWGYFSAGALAALEWGHPLGLPSLLARKLTGRWVLVPRRWNLALTEAILRRYVDEPLPTEGAYLFFVARKP